MINFIIIYYNYFIIIMILVLYYYIMIILLWLWLIIFIILYYYDYDQIISATCYLCVPCTWYTPVWKASPGLLATFAKLCGTLTDWRPQDAGDQHIRLFTPVPVRQPVMEHLEAGKMHIIERKRFRSMAHTV
jgi:hypothetical protein